MRNFLQTSITDCAVLCNTRKSKTIYTSNLVSNSDDLMQINNLANLTSNIIEELTAYVLFVCNTNISAKELETAYEEYLSAKQYADAKLTEALQTPSQNASNVDWVGLTNVLVERYSNQLIKYNNFAQELFKYTTKACFVNVPKTVKFTTLSFIQGFNNYMVNEYVAKNKVSTR